MSIAPALVPQELRPRRTQLWLLAGRTTWGFGSRAARAGAPQAGRPENRWLRWPSALWRIPATIVSWLAFLPHPETLAAQGKAHLRKQRWATLAAYRTFLSLPRYRLAVCG